MDDKVFFNLYKFLTSKEILLLRIFLFIVLGLVLLLFIDEYEFLIKLLPFYFLLFLQEFFIHLKLENFIPSKNVENCQKIEESMMFDIRSDYLSNKSSFAVVRSIALTKRGKFLLDRIGSNELGSSDFEKKEVAEKAERLVKALGGSYISSLDFLASYIILQKDTSLVFQKNELDEKDVAVALYWARKKFNVERKKDRNSFGGQGAFDFLVYGWTYETSNYTSDFTKEVMHLGYEPKAVGREKEYRELIEGLSKSSSRNIIVIGDEGVGKTNLVMKFAYDAYKGYLTKSLKNKRVYFIFVDRLISGVNNKGELEKRIVNVFAEISHSGNIIMLIENIENIFGGGGFNFDLSGALQPYLEGSDIQIVGTVNPQSYKEFISSKPSTAGLFSEVHMMPPDKNTAIFMLLEEATIRENLSDSIITIGAIKECIELSDVYEPDLMLPGSAVKLLEDAMIRNFQGGGKMLSRNNVKEIVNDRTGIITTEPTKEEKKVLLNIENEMHKKLIGQQEAVTGVANALRRLRSGIKKEQGPIASFLFMGPTGVGKTTTAKLLANEYFGSEDKMIRVDMSEYQSEESTLKLLGEMPGEDGIKNSLVEKVDERPFSLVLLDEFEKANPKLLDIFLQILDEGFVTSNKGKKVSFRNTIIIATSNAGSEYIRQKNDGKVTKKELLEQILTKGVFKPELINRFDDIIVFNPLSENQTVEIVKLRLTELKGKLKEQFIDISFSDSTIGKIAKESFDSDFGARNVRRYIEENIENLISRLILEEKIGKGENIMINVDTEGKFTFEK